VTDPVKMELSKLGRTKSRQDQHKRLFQYITTGKSLSEALLFAENGENMLCTKIVLNVRNNFCTQHVHCSPHV
jgi:hypothetical protein